MSLAPDASLPRPTSKTPSVAVSGCPKLARGQIPSSWSQPAELVTSIPMRAQAPWPAKRFGAIVAVTALLVFAGIDKDACAPPPVEGAVVTPASVSTTTALAPAAPLTSEPPAIASISAGAAPAPSPLIAAAAPVGPLIPSPPSTSSTAPSSVAPEDQGGDLLPAPSVARAAPEMSGITELPAKKKARALTGRAIAALRKGNFARAEPLLVRAALLDPPYAKAWRHLGIARAKLGDAEGARRAYLRYLALAPRAPDAAGVRKILAVPDQTPSAQADKPQ